MGRETHGCCRYLGLGQTGKAARMRLLNGADVAVGASHDCGIVHG